VRDWGASPGAKANDGAEGLFRAIAADGNLQASYVFMVTPCLS